MLLTLHRRHVSRLKKEAGGHMSSLRRLFTSPRGLATLVVATFVGLGVVG